jgi:apolipoprotein N-acyltransferase
MAPRRLQFLRKRTLALCALAGLLMALSFPTYHLGFLGFVCLVPLLFALADNRSEPFFGLGLTMGLVLYSGTFFWVAWATLPGALAAIGLLSVFLGIFTLIYGFFIRRWGSPAIWAFPFFWAAQEYVRSLGQLGFPWTSLCYSQTEYLPLIQWASLAGPYGISFWLTSINVLVFWSLRSRTRRWFFLLLPIPLILIPYAYGKNVMPPGELSGNMGDMKVALIQPNMDPEVKWDSRYIDRNFEVLLRMTRQVAPQHPDLVIWPETATPCYLIRQRKHFIKVRDLVDETGLFLLTGSPDYAYIEEKDEYQYFNSAFFFAPGRREIQRYSKMQLVPFSEKIPYDETIPLLRKINMGEADFTPGQDWTIFHHPKADFAVLICFESIFPQLARGFKERGADFLVIITNDGWFGRTPAPYQHAQIAIFRAIENRISIARCANTGVSMIIDPFGRVSHQTPIFEEKTVLAELPLWSESTFYQRHGEWVGPLCCLVTGLLLAMAALKGKRHRL